MGSRDRSKIDIPRGIPNPAEVAAIASDRVQHPHVSVLLGGIQEVSSARGGSPRRGHREHSPRIRRLQKRRLLERGFARVFKARRTWRYSAQERPFGSQEAGASCRKDVVPFF